MSHFDRITLSLIILLATLFLFRELQYQERRVQSSESLALSLWKDRQSKCAASGQGQAVRVAERAVEAKRLVGKTKTSLAAEVSLERRRVPSQTKSESLERRPFVGVHRGSIQSSRFKSRASRIKPKRLQASINLNLASLEELQTLPGVGPVLASRILEARSSQPQGSFTSLEDLTVIRGIKRKTLARFKPFLELEGI